MRWMRRSRDGVYRHHIVGASIARPLRGVRRSPPTIFVNRYILIIPAAVKLFRRRERKIGTGADVLAYVKVVPVALPEAYGRIFSLLS